MHVEQPILINKTQFPTEEIIFSHIGKTKNLWISLFEYIHSYQPEFSEEWKYYNDGKRWLLKVTRKSKTVFWLSVLNGSFRITFYFTGKAEPEILSSPISDALKDQFIEGKRSHKIHGITLPMKYKRDVEYAISLIKLKLSLK